MRHSNTTALLRELSAPRSYASDADANANANAARQCTWLLFVRQTSSDAFALTIVTQHSSGDRSDGNCDATAATSEGKTHMRNALYELLLDADALRSHTEELGIEVDVDAFVELLWKTLETRRHVDVIITENADSDEEDEEQRKPGKVSLLLTYKFSETISRKGCFAIPLAGANVPMPVVELLKALHSVPHLPVLMESQKQQRDAAAVLMTNSMSTSAKSTTASYSFSPSMSSQGQEASSQNSNDAASVPTGVKANPQVLKRHHVPTGATRRKGPKGAKLAKN
ncbi:hypothetical protein FI667_g11910, partial [Globisporangium splendens]